MARCTRYILCDTSLSVTCGMSVVFSGYSGFLNQINRYDMAEILLKEVLNTTKPQTKPYPIMLKRKCNSRMNKCYKLCLFNVSILYNICRFQDYLFHCQLTNPVHLSVYVLIADTMTFLLFVLLFS